MKHFVIYYIKKLRIMFYKKVNKLSDQLMEALHEQIRLLRLYGLDYKGTYMYEVKEFNILYINMKREFYKIFISYENK